MIPELTITIGVNMPYSRQAAVAALSHDEAEVEVTALVGRHGGRTTVTGRFYLTDMSTSLDNPEQATVTLRELHNDDEIVVPLSRITHIHYV